MYISKNPCHEQSRGMSPIVHTKTYSLYSLTESPSKITKKEKSRRKKLRHNFRQKLNTMLIKKLVHFPNLKNNNIRRIQTEPFISQRIQSRYKDKKLPILFNTQKEISDYTGLLIKRRHLELSKSLTPLTKIKIDKKRLKFLQKIVLEKIEQQKQNNTMQKL